MPPTARRPPAALLAAALLAAALAAVVPCAAAESGWNRRRSVQAPSQIPPPSSSSSSSSPPPPSYIGEIVSDSNFVMTVEAGQPTVLTEREVRFRPIDSAVPGEKPPIDVWYHVVSVSPPGLVRFTLADRPEHQVWSFSAAAVAEQRVVLLPPSTAPAPAAPVTLQLRVTAGRASVAPAAAPVVLRLRVRARAAPAPAFRHPRPVLRLEQVTKTDIAKDYFEIDGIDDDDPNLLFVITKAPDHGSLIFVYEAKTSVTLYEGNEFYLRDLQSGIMQYRYLGEKNRAKDTFEVFVTDGHFELTNMFTLEIALKNSKKDKKEANSVASLIQFDSGSDVLHVREDILWMQVMVVRYGEVNLEEHVRCYTGAVSSGFPPATPGEDFEPRLRSTNSSLLTFSPGVKKLNCDVAILDDDVYEGEEEFLLILEPVHGRSVSVPGKKSQMKIRITDKEDKPILQFDRLHVSVPDDSDDADEPVHSSSSVTVNVLRTGDLTQESRARIFTKDGSATKGLDYEDMHQLLVFSSGVASLPVRIQVFPEQNNKRPRRLTRSFYILMSPDDVVGAELGPKSSLTVTINPLAKDTEEFKVFPSRPVVLSLTEYLNRTNEANTSLSPGYHLVCVSSCDKYHPLFNSTQKLCEMSSVSDADDSVFYIWEVAAPAKLSDSNYLPFEELNVSTVFAPVHSKTLDPSYFGRNYKIRCSTVSVSEKNAKRPLGPPSISQTVHIGGVNETVCPLNLNRRRNEEKHAFIARMKFTDSASVDAKFRNKIHVSVEIPHKDGMLPLISTSPLNNPRMQLNSNELSKQHMCSNFIHNGTFLRFTTDKIKNSTLWSLLKGNVTQTLYEHLNLTSCTWTFNAWLHINQVIDTCGGKILSNDQDAAAARSWVSVQLPLYIALLHAGGPAELHHTHLLISLSYAPWLGHSLARQPQPPAADVEVRRVRADEHGRLVLEFSTRALFPGRFALRPPEGAEGAEEGASEGGLRAPNGVPSPFRLREAAGSPTKGPRQLWVAVSDFSLKDYSGRYTALLLPCVYSEGGGGECAVRGPAVALPLRVHYRRTSNPAPLSVALDTRFLLARHPPARPDEAEDYDGVFSEGDWVFGRVLWHPDQHLHSAYSLRVQRVLLCAAEATAPPPAACVAAPAAPAATAAPPSQQLLLLDRQNPEEVDKGFNDIVFNASFASDIPVMQHLDSFAGVDGFAFEIAPLYSPGAEQLQWFLQVIYTIGPVASERWRRSISPMEPLVAQDRSSVRSLRLQPLQRPVNVTEQALGLALGPALLLLLIPLLFGVLKVRMCRKGMDNSKSPKATHV